MPPLGNEFNNMLKTTSLLAFIGVRELFQDADIRYSSTFKPVEYFAGRRGSLPDADDDLGIHPGVDRAQARCERAGGAGVVRLRLLAFARKVR